MVAGSQGGDSWECQWGDSCGVRGSLRLVSLAYFEMVPEAHPSAVLKVLEFGELSRADRALN